MRKINSLFLFVFCTAAMMLCLSYNTSAANFMPPEITEVSSTSSEITISWNKIKGAVGYKLYMKNADGKFEGIASTAKTTYTVKKLDANKTYEFRMRAYKRNEDNSKDFGSYCETFSEKTKLPDITGFSFKEANTVSVTVKWNKVKGAQTYKVYYCAAGKKGYTLAGETTNTQFKVKNLDDSSGWKIKVIAKCKGNSSSFSDVIRLYTVPHKNAKPTVVSKDSASVTIKWTPSGKANLFYVYVATEKDGKYKKVAATSDTTYTYNKKTPNTTYYFKITPVIKTERQTSVGKSSSPLAAKTGNISISGPSAVRKGEYPEITVPYYNSKVKWKSSNTKVIKIKDGRIFAQGTGTATLTATYKNCKKSVNVTVTSPVVSYMSAVYDVTNNEWVFESRINERCYPASITKLITALVALKYMDVNDTIVVGNELNMVEALSSRCDIQKGEKFKLGDLLYGLLLPSGGDAAYTIAVNCARKVSGKPNMGYVEAKNYFVNLMNSYMKSIGATGTHCVNPHGYPVNGHYSTVHDLVLVAQQVLKNPTLKKVTSTPYKYVTALTGKGRSWRTTNSLLVSYSSFYSPYAHGMKTGTVNDNYTGIVSAATKNGRTIISVVIGCESYNARYYATHKLYNAYL